VLGILPGSDPRLTDQIVLVMAHLDHLGLAVPPKDGDGVFNGAMDNASGIATLIETARALATSRTGKGPRRSVIFMATTGEESGLLGSDYFAHFPTVALGRVVAVVNIDMPILTCDFGDIVAFGAERSTMAPAVRAAAAAEGLTVSPDPQPEEAVFTRSDHYPLVRAGVPAVFLKTGWRDTHGGYACRDAERTFRLNHYHEVSDDLSQPFDWEAGAKFVRVNVGIARRLADMGEAPRWYQGDYFGETFAPDSPKARR
jgi:Zn-dependent M28 family amino/carboxypeptidase